MKVLPLVEEGHEDDESGGQAEADDQARHGTGFPDMWINEGCAAIKIAAVCQLIDLTASFSLPDRWRAVAAARAPRGATPGPEPRTGAKGRMRAGRTGRAQTVPRRLSIAAETARPKAVQVRELVIKSVLLRSQQAP